LLIPLNFFPRSLQIVSSLLPFEHIAYTPLQIYLGRLSLAQTLRLLGLEYFWVVALIFLGHLWWIRATRKITIHGG
jgi:ABC-2 type transport system permease protein